MLTDRTDLLDDLATDDDAQRPDDRFVPLRLNDIVAALSTEPECQAGVASKLPDVARCLEDVIYQEADAFQRSLADRYADWNPDRDTRPIDSSTGTAQPTDLAALRCRIDYLLGKANFERLSEAQLAAALARANSLGLRVRLDPERVEQLDIWVRGQASVSRSMRTWRHPFKGVPRELEVFRRLVVIAKLRDESFVRLKMFKDIPAADVEALLPNARVSMSLFDRAKLVLGSAGALGSAVTKLVQFVIGGAVAVGALLWAVLVGTAMLAWRAFAGYRRTRLQRDSLRTRHLYFQNLANNAGVIHSLMAMVAQEEAKEAILLYTFSLTHAGKLHELTDADAAIEDWLRRRFEIDVNFDAHDAIETLQRFRLMSDSGNPRVCPPDQARELLMDHWRERRTVDYHESMARAVAD